MYYDQMSKQISHLSRSGLPIFFLLLLFGSCKELKNSSQQEGSTTFLFEFKSEQDLGSEGLYMGHVPGMQLYKNELHLIDQYNHRLIKLNSSDLSFIYSVE